MKISTRGRYALRLMLDVALHENGRCVSIKEIAARQEISEKYLEQIISVLCRAAFLKSTRGAQGGYTMRKRPEDVTVGMILRTMEGDLTPTDCVSGGTVNCPRAEQCVTWEVWEAVRQAVDQVVDSITLADLMNRYHEKVPVEKETMTI